MKKMKKNAEYDFIVNPANKNIEYVKKFGIHTQNLLKLFNEQRAVFDIIIGECKELPDKVAELMLKEEKYLSVLSKFHLSDYNQCLLVNFYPYKVNDYLEEMEKHVGKHQAYLCRKAQNLYYEILQDDEPNLHPLRDSLE